ncbi:MAG: 50S ribosomal protein L24 [Patescibacteria group bacterium]
MKIKTGDNVRITAGKEKGKTGKVVQVFPVLNKVVVENLNIAVKHLKKRGKTAGQRIEYSAPLDASNVRVIGKTGEGRVGFKYLEKDGKRTTVRILKTKKGSEDLD